ncbi:phage tail protein [Yersinia enterocolitica]|uniref:phage tail protein n=1 Tax=Yersinia enterocolitica TaxID=630 RepID=UPI00398D0E80
MDKLPTFTLPVWMNKGEPVKLMRACLAFWQQVYTWLKWPLNQTDPLTCVVPLLNALAYQRDVTQFAGEPLALFRKRVNYAFINARDAGSLAGFAAIFERLGIGVITQHERQPGYDWDVIIIRVNDNQLAENNNLMMALIRQYGRTCRRYIFQVINTKTLAVHGGEFGGDYYYHHAKLNIAPGIMTAKVISTPAQMQHSHEVYSAKLK